MHITTLNESNTMRIIMAIMLIMMSGNVCAMGPQETDGDAVKSDTLFDIQARQIARNSGIAAHNVLNKISERHEAQNVAEACAFIPFCTGLSLGVTVPLGYALSYGIPGAEYTVPAVGFVGGVAWGLFNAGIRIKDDEFWRQQRRQNDVKFRDEMRKEAESDLKMLKAMRDQQENK